MFLLQLVLGDILISIDIFVDVLINELLTMKIICLFSKLLLNWMAQGLRYSRGCSLRRCELASIIEVFRLITFHASHLFMQYL